MTCKCQCHETDNWPDVEAQSKAALPAHIVEFIDACRKEPEPSSQLIAVLHKVQEHFGYLGRAQMDAVAQLLSVPAARVSGIATFYHYFRTKPRGKYMINVCLGTACYVNGAKLVAARLQEELGIDFGETTSDGMFSLESTFCVGTCGLAPVVTINDQVHAKVQPDQIPEILRKVHEKNKAEKTKAPAAGTAA